MASISETDRAKMVTALVNAIGKEEANLLATSLNLDGQLASRDDLRVAEMAIRTDMQSMREELRNEIFSVRNELKDQIHREISSQTKQLFVGVIGVMATVTGIVVGLFALLGKL
jgi:hypothetical protein